MNATLSNKKTKLFSILNFNRSLDRSGNSKKPFFYFNSLNINKRTCFNKTLTTASKNIFKLFISTLLVVLILLSGLLLFIVYAPSLSPFILYNLPEIDSPKTTTPNPTAPNQPTPSLTPKTCSPQISAPPFTPTPQQNLNNETWNSLVDYALLLINEERHKHGVQNVSLSNINSAQLHAEDMLKHGYLSHWNLHGYSPYMTYTLSGGQGAVAQNCAWRAEYGNPLPIDVKDALEKMVWSMMHDGASSDWGHRNNILDPLNNMVSIGVAYNHSQVYLVQDFEKNYIDWKTFSITPLHVKLEGTILNPNMTIQNVAIFYDNPQPLTIEQLQNPPYNGSYGAGTYVGQVLPVNYYSQDGITLTADHWLQTNNTFKITFSLSQAIQTHKTGVYTLYLQIGSSTAQSLTTYSIWLK